MLTFFLNISLSILILLLTIVLFKEHLKWADVKPVYKKTSDKENIKKISGQLAFSKIYERCLYKQLYDYFDVIFSWNQCGFWKDFSLANCLLPMIENWRESLDQGSA